MILTTGVGGGVQNVTIDRMHFLISYTIHILLTVVHPTARKYQKLNVQKGTGTEQHHQL
jgi:hypothetical protein